MSDRELHDALLNALDNNLRAYGFVLNKRKGTFRRKNKEGWHDFQLVFLSRSPGWEVKIGLLIRKNIVEEIYHKASFFEPKYHKETPTIGVALENYISDGHDYKFTLEKIADISHCYSEILNLFTDIAEPFFVLYNSLEKLDKAINVEQGCSIFTGIKFEGNVGVIIAKLVGNPKYEQLKNKYRKYYEKLSNGFYLSEYEGVLRVLEEL